MLLDGESQTLISGVYHTLTAFHLPFLKTIYAAIAIAVSATGMAMKAPVAPILSVLDSNNASGIWNNQKPIALITVGVLVSPAPLNALAITIPIP